MTGRHAAAPDEAFDQRERDRAGAHRADVDLLEDLSDGSVPADADLQADAEPAGAAAPKPRAKVAAKKAPASSTTTPAKRASKR